MFENYKEKYENMKASYETLKGKYAELEKNYEAEMQLTSSMTRKLNDVADDYEKLITSYEFLVASPDYYNEARETYIEELKQQSSRAYGCGRQDAYAEMGIKNIEAHERGNCLAILENGDIVELITDLETVYDGRGVPEDEIYIDDLVEGETDE